MKKLIAFILLFAPSTFAAEIDESAPDRSSAPHVWGFEVDAIQPFLPTIGIVRPKLTRTLWGTPTGARGDLLAGAFIRPHVEHDVLYTIDEYMGTLGYRQYFWRGLHAEIMVSAGAAWGVNRFDMKRYETPTLFMDLNLGWRFGFFEPGGIIDKPSPIGLYVTPQAGFITSLGISDIGPRNGKPDQFPQGQLLVGMSF